MTVPVIAFFNNKGGVGKTSLVYHLSWMFGHLGLRVVAADLDPQANLTAAFLDEYDLEELWSDDSHPMTIYGALQPLVERTGDVADPHIRQFDYNVALLVGDMLLSGFEDELSDEWYKALSSEVGSFRVLSAFWRIMQKAAREFNAALVLVDLGPNLGATNRTALISSDYIVVPLAPDLFSLQGLRNLGPTLNKWRREWRDRWARRPQGDLEIPGGRMQPIGYIILQHSERLDRPVKAYQKWMARIPEVYTREILRNSGIPSTKVEHDPNCLARLKHYRSLIPMAQEARKPIFDLRPADGAIGSHYFAVQSAHADFEKLASAIAERTGLSFPLGREALL